MERKNNFYVSLDQARALKELGFDEPCQYYYQKDYKYFGSNDDYMAISGSFFRDLKNENWNSMPDLISAPTHEQVIEWFIGKNLIGTLEYRKFDEKDPYYAYCITNKMTRVLDWSSNTTRYNSYREAREALINKLIELYGNSI